MDERVSCAVCDGEVVESQRGRFSCEDCDQFVCRSCGSSSTPHYAKGQCQKCWRRNYMRVRMRYEYWKKKGHPERAETAGRI